MLFLLTTKDPEAFADSIQSVFPTDHIEIGPGQWILSTQDNFTAEEAWKLLVGTTTPSGVIVSFSGYYGRASSSVWEWIATRRDARK